MNRCAYLDSEHRFSIRDESAPVPSSGEVLVRIRANGICGSDLHFYKEGRLGNFVVSRPYIPGHEASGTVEGAGPGVMGFAAGDRVVIEPGIPCGDCFYCRIGRYNLCREVVFLSAPPTNGTFCDSIVIPEHCLHKMPESMTHEEAALVEPTAVAVHAVQRAAFRYGDTAAILGTGPIGLLVLQAFKAAGGGKAICLDRIDRRLETAVELGADEAIDVRSGRDLSDLADVVFETAGSSKATESLFRMTRTGGCAVQVGWPADKNVSMGIADFLDKELTYTGVYRYANAFPAAISWISAGRIDVGRLITHRFALKDIAEAFRCCVEEADQVIKAVVAN